MPVCAHRQRPRGMWLPFLSSFAHHLFVCDTVSHWIWSLIFFFFCLGCLSSELQDHPASTSNAVATDTHGMPSFYVSAVDLNLGPLTFVANVLTHWAFSIALIAVLITENHLRQSPGVLTDYSRLLSLRPSGNFENFSSSTFLSHTSLL